ncbi:hypothetical protein HMPREF1548_02034 [Clostridium sp. KLE 1755]|jgi:hypothetical protein|nr:hypothetical protein HMPREF1548_02034 [Clostridium sp. KLE 1755]
MSSTSLRKRKESPGKRKKVRPPFPDNSRFRAKKPLDEAAFGRTVMRKKE